MEKKVRQFIKIFREVCEENNIELKEMSDSWILSMKAPNDEEGIIIGYKFPNNNSSICRLCDDKAGLSSVMSLKNIPNVEHYYFEEFNSSMYDEKGAWEILTKMLQAYGGLVCKANSGSGGNFVIKCTNQKELETAVFSILKNHRAMAVSPLINIKNEYRAIVFNGRVMLIYNKQRPHVVGNGISTLEELIKEKYLNQDICLNKNIDLKYVPNDEEIVEISWKHNLGQGSFPEMIKNEKLIKALSSFALNVTNKLDIQLASVDIIRDDNDNLKILEINSGLMMEKFSKVNEECYQIAKNIYSAAICDFFHIKTREKIKPNIYEVISSNLTEQNKKR